MSKFDRLIALEMFERKKTEAFKEAELGLGRLANHRSRRRDA